MDAIDELVEHSRDHKNLREFHRFHRANPEILDFLVEEIQLRLSVGFAAYSNRNLWEYARWKLDMRRGPGSTYLMNDHAGIFYGRAIVILHPEFNGRCEFRNSDADAIFGTRLDPDKQGHANGYARRLQWADGTAIECGWRPSVPHVVRHVPDKKPDIHTGTRHHQYPP